MFTRDYPEPDNLPTESNWEYCRRFAAGIPNATLHRIAVELGKRRKSKKRGRGRNVEDWSIIGEITGHGSGVSNAIVERLKDKRTEGHL